MSKVFHLIQENEFDPVEGRLEYLKEHFYQLYEHLVAEGMDEYAEVILDGFEGVDIASKAWQVFQYPETVITPQKRLELYKNERED